MQRKGQQREDRKQRGNNDLQQQKNQRAYGQHIVLYQIGNHCRKIVKDLSTGWQTALSLGLYAFSGQHQYWLRTHRCSTLQIAQRIAHHWHTSQSDVITCCNFFQHARLRFTAMTITICGMWTKKHGIDARTRQCASLMHLVVYHIEHGHVEQPAPDTGLIGRHHHTIIGLVQARNRLQAAGNRLPFFRALDELIGIEIDDTVAVENNEFHSHSAIRLRSATRFIAWCNCANRARRLARNAASSTFTITLSKNASTGARNAAKTCNEPV